MQLEKIDFKWIWSKLHAGVGSNKNDYHLMQLSYLGIDQFPKIDTVVMRGAEQPKVFFHTDGRSDKIAALKQQPNISLHWYSREEKTQLSFKAIASLHQEDEVCQDKWSVMPSFSQECYHQRGQPGTLYKRELAEFNLSSESAFKNFTVVECHIITMDILFLKIGDNIRFRCFEGDDELTRIIA